MSYALPNPFIRRASFEELSAQLGRDMAALIADVFPRANDNTSLDDVDRAVDRIIAEIEGDAA